MTIIKEDFEFFVEEMKKIKTNILVIFTPNTDRKYENAKECDPNQVKAMESGFIHYQDVSDKRTVVPVFISYDIIKILDFGTYYGEEDKKKKFI